MLCLHPASDGLDVARVEGEGGTARLNHRLKVTGLYVVKYKHMEYHNLLIRLHVAKYEIVSIGHHLVYNIIGKQMDFIGKFLDTTGVWAIIG